MAIILSSSTKVSANALLSASLINGKGGLNEKHMPPPTLRHPTGKEQPDLA
jgi:hypothetical protein